MTGGDRRHAARQSRARGLRRARDFFDRAPARAGRARARPARRHGRHRRLLGLAGAGAAARGRDLGRRAGARRARAGHRERATRARDASASRSRTSLPRRRSPTPRHAPGCRAIRGGPGPPTSRARWWCCSTRARRIGCGTARGSSSDRTCPIGKGVSSSAALEVAAFEALAALAGVDVRRSRAGACRADGREPRRRRAVRRDGPDDGRLRPPRPPAGAAVPARGVGRPPAAAARAGGVRHRLGHPPRGIGRRLRQRARRRVHGLPHPRGCRRADGARRRAPGRVAIDDPRYGGYLANVAAGRGAHRYRDAVPERIERRRVPRALRRLDRYGDHVDPARSYAVARRDRASGARARARPPVPRAARRRRGDRRTRARALGELMYASHASYSACGLGSDGTDRLVELVRAAGPAAGIYGAKITGGGSGGTVAVLAAAGERAAVDAIARRYQQETGRDATVFAGSSSGARTFGVRGVSLTEIGSSTTATSRRSGGCPLPSTPWGRSRARAPPASRRPASAACRPAARAAYSIVGFIPSAFDDQLDQPQQRRRARAAEVVDAVAGRGAARLDRSRRRRRR